MQQAFKTMMGQIGPQSSQSPFSYPPPYTSGSSPSSGFPYPASSAAGPIAPSGFPFQPLSTSGPSTSTVSADSSVPFQAATSPAASETAAAVDASAIKAEAAATEAVENEIEVKTEAKRSAFVDVSPEETLLKSPLENFNGSPSPAASSAKLGQNEAASKEVSTPKDDAASGKRGSLSSVEALENMMEDPTVQKMVYPHLPEEMRHPATFKCCPLFFWSN